MFLHNYFIVFVSKLSLHVQENTAPAEESAYDKQRSFFDHISCDADMRQKLVLDNNNNNNAMLDARPRKYFHVFSRTYKLQVQLFQKKRSLG